MANIFPLETFIFQALVAGVLVAAMCGPLGCFVVWRRMAFFGDALAHSALLGVALGLALHLPIPIAVIFVCAAFALILTAMQARRWFATDTMLGILSHSSLALGIIAVMMLPGVQVDLYTLLFGDILAVSQQDLLMLLSALGICLVMLISLWKPLLKLALNDEVARAEGVNETRVQIEYMLLMAFVVAAAMQVVGVLMITALLVIPAAASRQLTRTPETMAAIASIIGIVSVLSGLASSLAWNVPTGPAIVLACTLFFLFSFWGKFFHRVK